MTNDPAPLGAGSVLVVDDSRTMRQLITKSLAGAGLPVVECDSGEEALDIAIKGPDRFAAIVLDVTLPGKDGYEVLAELQDTPATAAIPVLLITASATSTNDIVRGLQAGAVDHLAKPFESSILVAKVQAFCQRRRNDRALRVKLQVAEARKQQPAVDIREVAVGSIVAERYRLERQIGRGATSVVFEARDLELDERIALKLFTQHTDPGLLARFKQELTLARQIVHPNIVRVYDFGSLEAAKFLTMELLEGSDLRVRLTKKPAKIAMIDWLLQACSGLQAAHDRGVVHRDIKPENFFITTAEILKIMDFGIAKRVSATGPTMVGAMAGTPAYMAPEQITGFSSVTAAADLYALGVIMYEMFTGRLPFRHEETYPLLMMHVADLPDPPRQHEPSLPVEMDAMIMKLLAKKPTERFKSANELGRRLADLRHLMVEAS
jgi:DNA-binding response OmpR family regulator